MTSESTILVLGATGMLGHTVLRYFAGSAGYSVVGTVRSSAPPRSLAGIAGARFECGVNVLESDGLVQVFDRSRPAVVVNCVGLVKQLAESEDPLAVIPINSLLPHRLLHLCRLSGARLVHVSTDCAFDGSRGMYREADCPDAQDLYGRSKLLGEVDDVKAITLRTSIIGPELSGAHGLVGWFLAQPGSVRGFTRAIFSGLPTVELARIIRDFVVPRPELRGLYHVSAAPIAKYELLKLVAAAYGRTMEIVPDARLVIDRSLDSSRFRAATGYSPPDWPELIRKMLEFG